MPRFFVDFRLAQEMLPINGMDSSPKNTTPTEEAQMIDVPGHSLSELHPVPFKANTIDAVAKSDRSLNDAIGKHAAVAADWDYANLRADMTIWEGRSNEELFDGELPPAAISFDSDNVRRLGWYLLGRDGLALNYRINLNTKHLGTRSQVEVLETLVHEQIHEWEHIHGRTKGGRYHTKIFRDKAAQIGIPTHRNGYSLGPTAGGHFLRLLEKYGVHLHMPPTPVRSPSQASVRSTILPWACSCTRVWAARHTTLVAACGKCGEAFVRAVPSVPGGAK